jgi:hypothetical protein
MMMKKFEKRPIEDEAQTAEYDFENMTPNHQRNGSFKTGTYLGLNLEDEGTFNLDHRDALGSDFGPSSRFDKPESVFSGKQLKNFTTIKSQNNLSLRRPINSDLYDGR